MSLPSKVTLDAIIAGFGLLCLLAQGLVTAVLWRDYSRAQKAANIFSFTGLALAIASLLWSMRWMRNG